MTEVFRIELVDQARRESAVRRDSIPEMRQVFRVDEASMHAWQNLGYGPAEKQFFEKRFNTDIAYEMGIAMIGLLGPAKSADEIKRFVESEEGSDAVVWATRHVRGSSELRDRLRKGAPVIFKVAKKDLGRAKRAVSGLIDSAPAPGPEGYNDPENVSFTTSRGWNWVSVCETEDQEHEGELMRHCGHSNGDMFSLRDPRGRPHVTLGVDFQMKTIIELRGRTNSTVKREYWNDCYEMFKDLQGGRQRPFEFRDPFYDEGEGIEFVNKGIELGVITGPMDAD